MRPNLMNKLIFSSLFLWSATASFVHAQEDERAPIDSAPISVVEPRGTSGSAEPGDLVAGLGGFGGAVINDAFAIDTLTDTNQSVFSGIAVGGMAYDSVNERVLMTASQDDDVDNSEFSTVFEWPIAGGAPVEVGTLTRATDGSPLRIDGLAFSGGVLYGMAQFEDAGPGSAGLYSIDTGTFVGTQVNTLPDGAISGIGADAVSGTIYGVNDADGELQIIALDGTLTTVTAYPPAEFDIDGLAVGDGFAFLVTDDDVEGSIYVYDLNADSYVTPLTAPWVGAETFSGAAFISQLQLPESQPVPVLSPWSMIIMMLVLFGIAARVLSRQRA